MIRDESRQKYDKARELVLGRYPFGVRALLLSGVKRLHSGLPMSAVVDPKQHPGDRRILLRGLGSTPLSGAILHAARSS
jgi:hypothetical protein